MQPKPTAETVMLLLPKIRVCTLFACLLIVCQLDSQPDDYNQLCTGS